MPRDDDGAPDGKSDTEHALDYWRTLSALDFGPTEIEEVETCVRSISSTIKDWREAVRGDAAAAIRLVLPQNPPERVTFKVDLAMTVLLCRAFDNAAAALVLSQKLRSMPLDRSHRNRLATSWLVRNLYRARDYSESRLRPARHMRKGRKS
jgi:hypothetical protein